MYDAPHFRLPHLRSSPLAATPYPTLQARSHAYLVAQCWTDDPTKFSRCTRITNALFPKLRSWNTLEEVAESSRAFSSSHCRHLNGQAAPPCPTDVIAPFLHDPLFRPAAPVKSVNRPLLVIATISAVQSDDIQCPRGEAKANAELIILNLFLCPFGCATIRVPKNTPTIKLKLPDPSPYPRLLERCVKDESLKPATQFSE
ncbi:hypothetical protein VTK26DRAFT_6436 [Humicola hyalothermophila]